jgi:hypothetical protein
MMAVSFYFAIVTGVILGVDTAMGLGDHFRHRSARGVAQADHGQGVRQSALTLVTYRTKIGHVC